MSKTTLATIATLFILSGTDASQCSAESFGGTVMPYSLLACDGDPVRLADRL